ncbi:F0F1 ATP synthase subunit B [bacterium]|nr:F0F1 ATP synthase subunit B [bacterium]
MIEISWPLLITQVVTFLVAMVVVWKLFWGPLTKMMQERTRKISGDLEKADHGRREIESLEADYHRRLSDIEEHARKEINSAIQKGNKAKEDILVEARDEAQKVLDKTRRDLAIERDQVIRELRSQVTEISMTAIERILGESIDKQVQQRLLDDFIDEVDKVQKLS